MRFGDLLIPMLLAAGLSACGQGHVRSSVTTPALSVRTEPSRARVQISAPTILLDTSQAGVYFLPDVPPGQAVVQFLDPVTGTILQTYTIAPGGAHAVSPR